MEKEMATHSSVLAWRIPRIEDPKGVAESGMTQHERMPMYTDTHTHTHSLHIIFYKEGWGAERGLCHMFLVLFLCWKSSFFTRV